MALPSSAALTVHSTASRWEMNMAWVCNMCGVEHEELPTCYGAEAPWRTLVPEDEFDDRVKLDGDICVVDRETFLIRGHIDLPIRDAEGALSYSVWCSLSKDSFGHMLQRWHDAARVNDPPYFGWLMTSLPTYPETLHLKCHVHNREPGMVPLVELEATDHPLAVEQRDGIELSRVEQLAHILNNHEG
jgi:hypothetical protein